MTRTGIKVKLLHFNQGILPTLREVIAEIILLQLHPFLIKDQMKLVL
jgi:hypothetical protein